LKVQGGGGKKKTGKNLFLSDKFKISKKKPLGDLLLRSNISTSLFFFSFFVIVFFFDFEFCI